MEAESALVGRWRELATRYNTVACVLERALQDDHGITMSEYETLDRIVDLNCEKCRMQEIAAAMYLSQSALSRTVARLEKHGYVQRALCQDDRRGIFVELTDEGRRRHAEARETHLKILAAHLPPGHRRPTPSGNPPDRPRSPDMTVRRVRLRRFMRQPGP